MPRNSKFAEPTEVVIKIAATDCRPHYYKHLAGAHRTLLGSLLPPRSKLVSTENRGSADSAGTLGRFFFLAGYRMGCLFSCFHPCRRETSRRIDDSRNGHAESLEHRRNQSMDGGVVDCVVSFTFKDLANATQNFKESNLLGEGGFGKVVAIKQLNLEGLQGAKEFLTEVLILGTLQHSNLVNLVGYCIEGDQRLLVYEFMPMGSLEDHLFHRAPAMAQLEWNTRIKIALGAAQGLAYLHDVANPPVIYRDMKAANVLLDNDFNPKLSDFGLAKIGPVGDNTHVSTRVMGTYGYCAPDYAMSGKLTMKSDIYSFGVLLLELITGRKAFDTSKAAAEQNLVTWAWPFLFEEKRSKKLADPSLRGRYPENALRHLVVIASMCLQEQARFRPLIGDVVFAINFLATRPYIPETGSRIRRSPSSSPLCDTRTPSRFHC
ncbi:hypothetical protein IEQ34_015017 [Dendrobium chrysotoxum]|uniref:Protein kinase domain-containing protein n=1 Tax=Dendrobium chrysotoxum TaxID=161865 RepID=A0AAV7G5H9_DENCH|nr:hypothetical protein IEQ34_015017 [Dendrobium chrysotoxum]